MRLCACAKSCLKTEEKVLTQSSKKLFPSLSYDDRSSTSLSLSFSFFFLPRRESSSTRSQPLEVVDTTRLSLRIFFFLCVSVCVVSLLSLTASIVLLHL